MNEKDLPCSGIPVTDPVPRCYCCCFVCLHIFCASYFCFLKVFHLDMTLLQPQVVMYKNRPTNTLRHTQRVSQTFLILFQFLHHDPVGETYTYKQITCIYIQSCPLFRSLLFSHAMYAQLTFSVCLKNEICLRPSRILLIFFLSLSIECFESIKYGC